MSKIFPFDPETWIRNAFLIYFICSLALMLPSFGLWFREDWPLSANEFDFWIGWGPFFGFTERGWKLLGNALQSFLFLGAGLGFWASAVDIRKGLENGKATMVGMKIAAILVVFSLGIPWFSIDCFYYLAKGWLEGHYGLDVYQNGINMIPDYGNDVFFQNVYPGFVSQLGNYGPLFQSFMCFIAQWGGGDFKITFILLRLSCLLAILCSAWFVVEVAKREGMQRPLTAYLYLGNPLIVFNVVTAMHIDAGSNLFVLAALFFAWNRKAFWSGLFFGFAVAWKFVPLLLLPPLVFYFVRLDGKWTYRPVILFLAAFSLALGGCFIAHPSALPFFLSLASGGLPMFRSSLALVLIPLFSSFYDFIGAFLLAKKIMSGLFLGLCGWLLWPYLAGRRMVNPCNLVFISVLILLLYLLVAATQVTEWYFTGLIGLTLLLREERVRFFALAISVFYMPWVNFMREQPVVLMILSQVGAYAMTLWLAARWIFLPLIRSSEWRDQMLGPAVRKILKPQKT